MTLTALALCLALPHCARRTHEPPAVPAPAAPGLADIDEPAAIARYVETCQAEGRSDQALVHLTNLHRADPSHATLASALSALAFEMERYPLAAEAYLAFMEARCEDAVGHYREGLAHAAAGHHAGARLIWERVVEKHPGHQAARDALANLP